MTERDIQNALYRARQAEKHEAIVPNCGMVFGWEADLVSMTKAGLVHEHEIKVSRSDFKADQKKEWKHKALVERKVTDQYSDFVHIPNYFWYVTPPELLDGLEIPEYAGHMTITSLRGAYRVLKQAPRLHRERISEPQVRAIARGLMYRYWKQRLQTGEEKAA